MADDSAKKDAPADGDKEKDKDKEGSWWNRNKTLVRHKSLIRNQALYKTLEATMIACLDTEGKTGDDWQKAVALPDGEDVNEWIALTTFQLFEAVNKIYGIMQEHKICTDESCPEMSAGPKFTYLWKYKKATKVSAPTYIEECLNWGAETLQNPKIFPVDEGDKFPKDFIKTVQTLFKRLFRIYGHTFHSHYEAFQAKGVAAHLNSCFKFFIFFALQFDLLSKQEMAPLKKLILKFAPKAFDEKK